MMAPGQIIVLNGAPRSGKSSLARAIQDSFDGVWMNLGVDGFKAMTPQRVQPGIGLRPGGERPDLEPLIASLYLALYQSIAAHSRLGVNVVADLGHHDGYSQPRHILPACARVLEGLPAWLIGVRCPIEVVMARRAATWNQAWSLGDPIPAPVQRFQDEVHRPGLYDLEVDTSALTSEACGRAIAARLAQGPAPTAFAQLAALGA